MSSTKPSIEIAKKWTGNLLSYFQGWIHDWFWLETENGTAITKVVHDGVKVKILGGLVRTFKPETPFSVYVSDFIA